MPAFGRQSLDHLVTCQEPLRRVLLFVVLHFDCSVLEGVRLPERQQELYDTGATRTLDSRHLPDDSGLSSAVDVAPYPVVWPNREAMTDGEWMKAYARFYLFAGFVLAVAASMGIRLRWGGDWDGDKTLSDQTFDDLVHFELVD